MEFLGIFQDIVSFVLNLVNSIYFLTFIFFIIIFYHVLFYFLVEKNDIKAWNSIHDPSEISLSDLQYTPTVNIIVPAWKEGEIFEKCLLSIKELNYPKVRAIINAGGNDETLRIANSFKKYENFIILHQKAGANRASLGKIKAINECLEYVSEGILYFIDADSHLNDHILIRMIFPIINLDENVVVGGVRPLESQQKKIIVKYLLIDRFKRGRTKFSRYPKIIGITGQNFSIKYEALKKIDKFSQDKTIATDISMGYDIKNKGFKLYQLKDYPHRIFVDYSNSLREYFKQKTIWVENYLLYSYFFAKKGLIKFILLFILSTFIILTPFLFIINIGIQIIGFLIFINIYLIKIRKLLFFKSTVDKKYYDKFKLRFYISLFFLIYFEALINLTIPFHFVYFIIKLKKKRIKT